MEPEPYLRRLASDAARAAPVPVKVAERGLGKAVQAGLDGSGIWPHLGAGCHLARDTVSAIAAAGFTVGQVRRFTSVPGRHGLPFVLGTARRKPAQA